MPLASTPCRQLTLAEACTINPKKSELRVSDSRLPVSFIPMAAVDEVSGSIITHQTRPISEVEKGFTYFREGDVLFAKITPCMENGKAAIARGLINGIGFGSTEFHILRPNDGILPEWVFYFVRSKGFREQAAVRMTGSAGQQRVPAGFFMESTIPVPPIEEQGRIVEILNEANAARRARAETIEKTNQLTQAIFYEMFGDPGNNSKGWPIASVGELLIACDYGSSQKASGEPVGIPMLRMNNVTSDGSLNLADLKYVKLTNGDLQKYRLHPGDVLFNRTNSRELIGKTGLWDGRFEAVAASYFIRLRFDETRENPYHFATFMNLPMVKRRLTDMARGAIGQSNINAKELRSIRLPCPPVGLQREFADRVVEVGVLRRVQHANHQLLDQLLESLLVQAFSGGLHET